MREKMTTFNSLKGKKIKGIGINEEKDIMRFELENDTVRYYQTVGDCCNQVWFEDMDLPDALCDGTVGETWETDWQSVDDQPNQFPVLDKAFWTIKTDKGHCTIEVRNSHNGYYGGQIIELDDFDEGQTPWRPVGTVFEQTLDKILGV